MQQSPIISVLHVRNNFIKQHVTVKSRDRMSALFRRQTSNEYNNTGIHLLFSRCRKTYSEASLMRYINLRFTYIFTYNEQCQVFSVIQQSSGKVSK